MSTSVENNSLTTGGVTGKGFLPGQSGNPGGRPKGLASYIRKLTNDGTRLADLFFKVFNGEEIDGQKPTLKDQLTAASWLADRGYGKPVQYDEESEDSGPTMMVVRFVGSDEYNNIYSDVDDE